MPKVSLALAGIGLFSFTGAALLVTNNHSSPQVLGIQSTADDTALGEPNGSEGEGGNNAAKKSESTGVNKSKPRSGQSGSLNEGGTNSSSSKPSISSTQSPSTSSRSGYNLNDHWYLATASAEGLYNSCWPTELNESNEAGCVDESNPYSHYWFEGVGISKSTGEAQDLAAADLQQKADEKHVDLRRGAGGDTVVLTETLCSSYGLSCGRW